MITRLEIEGFRSFRDVAVDLAPFTVLVGQNGSGKTNLLEAVDLAAQILNSRMSSAVLSRSDGRLRWGGELHPGGERRGILHDLFYLYGDGTAVDQLHLGVSFLTVDERGELRHQRLDMDLRNRSVSQRPWLEATLTPLAEAPEHWGLSAERQEQVRRYAERPALAFDHLDALWYRLAPSPAAARVESELVDDVRMAADARNLSAVVGRLAGTSYRESRQALLLRADVVAVLPGLIDLRPVANEVRGVAELDLVYRQSAPTPLRLASDGTLHALAVLAAAHDGVSEPGGAPQPSASNECTTLMVEDVENGLHPAQVKELVRRLRNCTGGEALQQIIVTTHSPVVFGAVYPEHTRDVLFADTVIRAGGGEIPSRHTRVRPVAEHGERGTYVSHREARKYLESATATSL